MSKRHRDALAITGGACNPTAIANSILDACKEMWVDNADTQAICDDPAIRLMVYQLGFITRAGSMGVEDYELAENFCKAKVEGS